MEWVESSSGSLSRGDQGSFGRSVNNNIRKRTNWRQTMKDTTTSSIASYPAHLNVSIALQSSASMISFLSPSSLGARSFVLCHTPLTSLTSASPPPFFSPFNASQCLFLPYCYSCTFICPCQSVHAETIHYRWTRSL
jgi:hypothetical protein